MSDKSPFEESFNYWMEKVKSLPEYYLDITFHNIKLKYKVYNYENLLIMKVYISEFYPVCFIFGEIKDQVFVYHRMNGPAYFDSIETNFYINGKKMSEKSFKNFHKNRLIKKIKNL